MGQIALFPVFCRSLCGAPGEAAEDGDFAQHLRERARGRAP